MLESAAVQSQPRRVIPMLSGECETTSPVTARRVVQPLATEKPASRCAGCNLRGMCVPAYEQGAAGAVVYIRKRVKRGEALFRSGQEFRSLFAVRTGFFKSRVTLDDGRDQVTGFHMGGDLLGLDGIGTEHHAADMIALEDSEVCVIPYSSFDEPVLQRQLSKVMSRELVHEQGLMALLGTMRAEQRLAVFLLNLSRRFLDRGYSQHEFHLRMTREEIGSYLGLSLETVSRLLSRFQGEGLISVHQKHVHIKSLPALKEILSRDLM